MRDSPQMSDKLVSITQGKRTLIHCLMLTMFPLLTSSCTSKEGLLTYLELKKKAPLSSGNHHHRIMGRKDTHLKSMDNCTNHFSQSSIQKGGVSLFLNTREEKQGVGKVPELHSCVLPRGLGIPGVLALGLVSLTTKAESVSGKELPN